MKSIGYFIVFTSPSLMMFLVNDFIRSHNYGVYPDVQFMSWLDISALAFAIFWQLAGIYGMIFIDAKMETN